MTHPAGRVRHRFVSDLAAELSELAFVAQNEAKVVDLARNQTANTGFLWRRS